MAATYTGASSSMAAATTGLLPRVPTNQVSCFFAMPNLPLRSSSPSSLRIDCRNFSVLFGTTFNHRIRSRTQSFYQGCTDLFFELAKQKLKELASRALNADAKRSKVDNGGFAPGANVLPSGLLIKFMQSLKKRAQFMFCDMWLLSPQFDIILEEAWNHEVQGNFMYQLVKKMQFRKAKLKYLHRTQYGNIHERMELARNKMLEAQIAIHNNTQCRVLQEEELLARRPRTEFHNLSNDAIKTAK